MKKNGAVESDGSDESPSFWIRIKMIVDETGKQNTTQLSEAILEHPVQSSCCWNGTCTQANGIQE